MLPSEKAMKERTVLTKSEFETDPNYGKSPSERNFAELLELGIININKPKGPTSHQVSEYVKNILKIKKAGQSGTLDPGVTGVLPIGIGRGTRVLRSLLKSGKEYVCLMHVHGDIEKSSINKTLGDFVGEIKQLPPIKSAVKRQLRTRRVYYIDIIEINGKDILFKVGCQAGTYIRKLCDDIGKKLGCGAHMAQLVRTRVGIFDLDTAHTLQDLTDSCKNFKEIEDESYKKIILPIELAVEHIPKIWVHDSAVDALCHGSSLAVPGIAKLESDVSDNIVAVMTLKDELIGLGTSLMSSKKIMFEEKGLAVKMETIIMNPGTYPKWKNEKSSN